MAEDRRPADDDTVLPNERIYVRIYPAEDAIVPVMGGGYRPISGSIKGRDMDEPMSVDLGSLCTPEQTRDRGPGGNFYVAMFTAVMARSLGLRIGRDPVEDPPNAAHALIYGGRTDAGDNLIGGLTNKEYEKLARLARIILPVQPPQQPPPEL